MDSKKYKEICRLHEMLTDAGIEHEWVDRFEKMIPKHEREFLKSRPFWQEIDWGYQIIVYKPDGERLVSAIEGYGTYGESADRIEIMGLAAPDEDDPTGWLTAENVFARIQHWREKHGSGTC